MRTLLWLLLPVVMGFIPNDIRCMNFYGLETDNKDMVCGWQHRPRWYLDQLKDKMFINTIRLPFSYEYVREAKWKRMDEIIGDCELMGVRIILDYHRTWNSHQGPKPEEQITREQFIEAWITVLGRYADCPNLFGVGVFNEIQAYNDFVYTMDLHRVVVAEIEKVFPNRFFYFLGCPNWGGNCSDMDELVDMPTWNRTYIEVHKYSFSGNPSKQDWDTSIPESIPPSHWFIGEMGWKMNNPRDVAWANEFISYLKWRRIYNVCLWTIAHSGDTEGWWHDDCETLDMPKVAMSAKIWFEGSLRRGLRGTNITDLILPPPPSLSDQFPLIPPSDGTG